VTYRDPDVDVPLGSTVRRAVSVFYGGRDSYGFHLLETLQCLVERRKGGETGVAAVQCLENEAVWQYLERTPWAGHLLEAALTRSKTRKPGKLQEIVKDPAVYLVDYRDGLEGAAFMLNGAVNDATAAVEIEGRSEPLSTIMWLERGAPSRHFACLAQHAEKMFQNGKPPYPVQRTLLTSGILDAALESRFQGHKRIETDYLDVRYQAPQESQYCHGKPPWA
jgi:hypothetical protein